MKKLLISLIYVVFCISMMAQNADLKLKLEKNKTYRLKSVSNQTISQTINGMEQTTSLFSNTVFSIKMMDFAAGFIVAEVRFDTLLTNTNTMGKLVKVNSALEGNIASEEAGDVMTAIMNRLCKNALYVKMNEAGKVIEIVNLAMLQNIVLKDTASINAKLAPILKPQVKNTVTNDGLKTMIEMFTYSLPGKQVKPGDQWNITVPVNSGGMSLEIVTNYKLGSISDNTAFIQSESTIKPTVNAAPLEYPGAKITYDGLSGMAKSDMKVNTATGMMVENSSKTNITGNLNVNASGMSMQIPMNITGETIVKSLQ